MSKDMESLVGKEMIDLLARPFEITDFTADGEAIQVGGADCLVFLDEAVAIEDRNEEFGLIEPDDRVTCSWCKAWATDAHMSTWLHKKPTAEVKQRNQNMDPTVARVVVDIAGVLRASESISISDICHRLILRHPRYRGLDPWLLLDTLSVARVPVREIPHAGFDVQGIHSKELLARAFVARAVVKS